MVNRSVECYNLKCRKDALLPIYYRGEDRTHRVAFYICMKCMNFFEFIDWDATPHRKMPFYNDMLGMVLARLVKDLKDKSDDLSTRREKILLMQKDDSKPCIKCNSFEIERLYFRERPKFHYVGYVCKNCRTIYLINRKNFRLKTYSPHGYYGPDGTLPIFNDIPFDEYMGQWSTASGKPKKTEYEEFLLRVPKRQIEVVKQFLKKKKIQMTKQSVIDY